MTSAHSSVFHHAPTRLSHERSFMEKYAPSWSPNEGDSARRYTFQNQPDVAAWNCERLSEAFSSLVGEHACPTVCPRFPKRLLEDIQKPHAVGVGHLL